MIDDDDDISPEEAAFLQEELLDADIASYMGRMYMNHPKYLKGMSMIDKDGDAGAMIAKTLIETRTKLIENQVPHSGRIWTSEHGVLDDMIETYANNAKVLGKNINAEQTKAAALKVLKMYGESATQQPQPSAMQPGKENR